MDDDAADEGEVDIAVDGEGESKILEREIELGTETETEVGSEDAVGDKGAASVAVDETGTGGNSVAATLSGSGTVPVIWLNNVHSSPL